MEITDRIKAIAAGEDPDSVEATATESVTDGGHGTDAEPEPKDTPGQAGQEASVSGGGTDAAGSGGGSTVPEWADDEAVALAESYGLKADELSQFSDPESFQAACLLFDKQLKAAPEAATTKQGATEAPAAPTATPAASEPPKPAPSGSQPAAKGDEFRPPDPEWFKKEGYDDETIRLAEASKRLWEQNKALEARVAKQEELFTAFHQQVAKSQHDQVVRNFDNAVDQMDAALYGRRFDDSGNEMQLTPDQIARRQALWNEGSGLLDKIKARGLPIPPINVFLKRVEQFAFPEDVRKKERDRIHAQLSEQSKLRRPVPARTRRVSAGRNKPKGEPATPDEITREILANPDVQRIFEEAGA